MDKRRRSSRIALGTIVSAFLGCALGATRNAHADTIYDVSINTGSLIGTDATLAFDFTAGGGPSNTVTISDFSTDGTLGAAHPNSGTVTGSLPGTVSLSDASNFFNENLQGLELGSTISLQLDASVNGPTASSLPDTFAFFILDSTASTSLLTTSDPTSANSLFTLQLDGTPGGDLGIYSSTPVVSVTASPVPVPGALGLLLCGIAGIGLLRLQRQRNEVGAVG